MVGDGVVKIGPLWYFAEDRAGETEEDQGRRLDQAKLLDPDYPADLRRARLKAAL